MIPDHFDIGLHSVVVKTPTRETSAFSVRCFHDKNNSMKQDKLKGWKYTANVLCRQTEKNKKFIDIVS